MYFRKVGFQRGNHYTIYDEEILEEPLGSDPKAMLWNSGHVVNPDSSLLLFHFFLSTPSHPVLLVAMGTGEGRGWPTAGARESKPPYLRYV
ncbi:hypothetical protein TNIN_358441 [Trichonephila inaurata madagascariensis]|uniref:Uncharacterized protein n=1 Tax=Trichonephila inaurata madagascariensis TaxID=2747483 RepID=A0A8X6XMI2_9ARAC|nr:hypothetical protein TNIN_358441 [Trichonephila inaurata madagascariensis]